jgi:aerobic-type carbon monoxide dehydrogenase small subunit (CoxS/CutS family)
MIIELTLNGVPKRLQARSGDRLADMLRRELAPTSLIADCLAGRCGRCFIFLDGRLAHSCLIPAFKAKGGTIVTFEALADTDDVKEITQAFKNAQAQPCRFCRNAKIMAIVDLLSRNPLPDRGEILEQLDMVSCPCTDPESLVKAVDIASELRNKRKFHRANK